MRRCPRSSTLKKKVRLCTYHFVALQVALHQSNSKQPAQDHPTAKGIRAPYPLLTMHFRGKDLFNEMQD